MQLFNVGETVIDTKIDGAVEVVSIIPQGENSLCTVYVLSLNKENADPILYLSTDDGLIVYDKYYWDSLEK
jgi:hypothetical protein